MQFSIKIGNCTLLLSFVHRVNDGNYTIVSLDAHVG